MDEANANIFPRENPIDVIRVGVRFAHLEGKFLIGITTCDSTRFNYVVEDLEAKLQQVV